MSLQDNVQELQSGLKARDFVARQDADNVSPRVLEAERIISSIDPEEQAVLFHSGDASLDEQLRQGIEPTFGAWLEEVLCGATDDDEAIRRIREEDPVAFYAETPRWVSMKASRAAGKHVANMTVDDLVQHGQLCIVVVDRDDRSIWRASEEDKDEAEQFCGQGRYTMTSLPFGVEPGNIFTTDAFIPEITLTGRDLVQFLARNHPGANLMAEPLPGVDPALCRTSHRARP